MSDEYCGIDLFRYLTEKILDIAETSPPAGKDEVAAVCIKVDDSLVESLLTMEERICAWVRQRGLPVLVAVFGYANVDRPVLITGKGLEDFDRSDPATRGVLLEQTGWATFLAVACESEDREVRVKALRELIKLKIGG